MIRWEIDNRSLQARVFISKGKEVGWGVGRTNSARGSTEAKDWGRKGKEALQPNSPSYVAG